MKTGRRPTLSHKTRQCGTSVQRAWWKLLERLLQYLPTIQEKNPSWHCFSQKLSATFVPLYKMAWKDCWMLLCPSLWSCATGCIAILEHIGYCMLSSMQTCFCCFLPKLCWSCGCTLTDCECMVSSGVGLLVCSQCITAEWMLYLGLHVGYARLTSNDVDDL